MDDNAELTLRALLTGLLIGAVLTPCNIYSGLKIGWSFNMSIIALLIGFGFWRSLHKLTFASKWSIKESNINQTAASSAASIISGGLVAPIPAYTLLTGEQIPMLPLMAWVFAVSFLGIWVAWYLRPLLIIVSPLPFPAGSATLETMNDIFGRGREALLRIMVLLGSAFVSGALKWINSFVWVIPQWAPGALLKKLTFTLDPSLLLLGFGAIIGPRVGISLLIGSLVAWGLVSPLLLEAGVVNADVSADATLFGSLVEWLLWPGVSLMVAATLTNFLYRSIDYLKSANGNLGQYIPLLLNRNAGIGLATAVVITVTLQILMFDISLFMALLAIPMALILATVAARVVGETGIPPIGAIGKVSQLGFGVADPGNMVTNLMTANIAGGAAGQSADLLNDFKVGHGIDASPMKQAIAQCFGILTGSIVGVVVYVNLIPDPQSMLLTLEWPAPAVATWKAVAQALSQGVSSIPPTAQVGMVIGAAIGLGMGVLEILAPKKWLRFLPSAPALGLAFVIPASISMMMFLGALLAWVFTKRYPHLSVKFLITAAAGLIAGESIVGVAESLWGIVGL